MRTLNVIGIGTGNPAHLTLEGVKALSQSNVAFIPTKGEEKAALATIRRDICAAHLSPAARIIEYALPVRDAANPDYVVGVDDWHAQITRQYVSMISAMDEDEIGAFLVWGDPSLYDSTLRILDRARETGAEFVVKVVPGITAIQALTAAFAIPLNTIGNPIAITTGRRLAESWPDDADTVVVMLDGQKSFRKINPVGVHIWWGAYVGMEQQMLIEGPLIEAAERICDARDKARAEHGWVMDVYLLRRQKHG